MLFFAFAGEEARHTLVRRLCECVRRLFERHCKMWSPNLPCLKIFCLKKKQVKQRNGLLQFIVQKQPVTARGINNKNYNVNLASKSVQKRKKQRRAKGYKTANQRASARRASRDPGV